MGRKIPARKHHGVRDPLRQAADRLALIKDKINHPPVKQDFQKVSHNLATFIRLKEEAKSGKPPAKRRRGAEDGCIEDRPENYKPNSARNPRNAGASAADATHRHDKRLAAIKRMPNEPDIDYLRRVNRVTQASIKESQFEAKYGVEVVRNEQTGQIKIKKRPTDEIEERMKVALKARQRGELDEDGNLTEKGKKKRPAEKKMSKEESRRLVKEMVAKKKEDKAKAAAKLVEYKQDVVAFGEVTHGPPTLVTPRRAQKAETVPRPGKKSSLLLHSVLDPKDAAEIRDSDASNDDNSDSSDDDEDKPPKAKQSKRKRKLTAAAIAKKPIDLKGKRKELPAATRQMIEKQQQSVMDAYRQLKKTNRLNNVEL